MTVFEREADRIREVYERRYKLEEVGGIYSPFNPASLLLSHQRERKLLALLRKYGFNDLENKKILDIGCGYGGVLRRFLDYGALPEDLYGIDILADRIERGKRISPHLNLFLGNASELPFDTAFFDIVVQFTVFTSILDSQMKNKIAGEMLRVVKPEGIIIWYDYYISKPTNPDVKGVGKREIKRLFPCCSFDFNRVTLAPPLARLLAPHFLFVCYLLELTPFLRTHYLAVIRRIAG